jgi:hypothetical protein
MVACKEIWIARCSAIQSSHLLFKDRLKLFPVPKPSHEMTGDHIAFAKNLQDHLNQLTCINTAHNVTLSVTQDNVEKSPTTKSYKFTKPTYGNKRKTISLDDLNQSSHPPKKRRNDNLKKIPRPKKIRRVLPGFVTSTPLFADILQRGRVQGDGNCLLRSIFRAMQKEDDQHQTLRLRCVQHIIHHWERFKDFAIFLLTCKIGLLFNRQLNI